MKLTIEQAAQRGIAAQKKGKFQDAELIYRTILKSQPLHPDVNHNLGVLLVSLNKDREALPFFKTSIEANPKIERYWLSYIDALIKDQQFEPAKQVIQIVKNSQTIKKQSEQRLDTNDLSSLEAKLTSLGRTERAEHVSPPQQQLDTLLEYYNTEQYSNAEKLATRITKEFSEHPLGWQVLGALFGREDRNAEALNATRKAAELSPQDASSHNNLGIALHKVGMFEESEASYRHAISLKSNFAEAHFNLSILLQAIDKFSEAETSLRNIIALNPDSAEAHNNLGASLQEQGKFLEAEASFRKAIAIKNDYAVAYCNLGKTLQRLGRYDESETNCRQAIVLRPDYADAQCVLALALYGNGDIDSALSNIELANLSEPESSNYRLLLRVLQSRKSKISLAASKGKADSSEFSAELPREVITEQRLVERELLNYLSELESLNLVEIEGDPSFGNTRGKGSLYSVLEDKNPVIEKFAKDLENILKNIFDTDIFIIESFCTIFGSGGGTGRHHHLSAMDKDPTLNLTSQKYSLVYYLSVGDQACNEPGILTLYEPSEEILPSEGMIIIFPADRDHSSVYGGDKERVILAVNFYCL